MNYKEAIAEVFQKVENIEVRGKVASYIPELANVDPNKFGVHISTNDGEGFGMGDHQEKFSLQSITKVFSLCLAYKIKGESIWTRLGVEPSGNRFNSLIQLDRD
ncbi:MAG: glutaminase, partial [Saprospiraceae bacterium]|nr:glutaminase [Saprospiraceae bacterium]